MKNTYMFFALIIGMVIIMPISSNGQKQDKKQIEFQMAKDEAETILSKSDSISDLQMMVKVKSKAANLLWSQQPEQSREIFIKLWDTIDKRTDDNSFDEENARMDLLEYLFPKDRTLAIQLIEKSARKVDEDSNSQFEKLKGTNAEARRLAFLSYRLAEDDVTLAARILEQGLSENTAPLVPAILSRIREKNPLLANYVASRAIENFNQQSPTSAIIGLGTLAGYLFPLTPSPSISLETIESDENLRTQFMFTGYRILKNSLAETKESLVKEQNFTDKSLAYRNISQALAAGTLAVLSLRYAPQYYAELNVLAGSLIQTLPKQFIPLVELQIAAVRGVIGSVEKSETSEAEIINAIAREDFSKAQSLIDEIKDETKKKAWTEILLKAQAKVYLKRGDLLLALNTVRKMDNTTQAIELLVEIAQVAHKRKDEVLSLDLIQEAQKTATKSNKGIQAKTLFSIAAETAYFFKQESANMLQTSVEAINSLSEIEKDNPKKASFRGENYWNDPDNFLNSTAMQKAFAVLGEMDIQETLTIANRLKNKPLQMMARLAAVEKILKKSPLKVKLNRQMSDKKKG